MPRRSLHPSSLGQLRAKMSMRSRPSEHWLPAIGTVRFASRTPSWNRLQRSKKASILWAVSSQDFPEQIRSHTLPAEASLTVVTATATEGSKTLTAPVLDDRGAPKIQTVYVTTFGKQVPTLKWSVVTARALPAATATTVIRIAAF